MKKWFLPALMGVTVVLQSSADVRIAQKWTHASSNTADHTFELATDVVAQKGDVFVLTYAANKKGLLEFAITSPNGQVSEKTHYEKSNGAVAGIIYYQVNVDGLFNLATHQFEAIYSACGAYHLTSDSGLIEELVQGERMVGSEGAEQIKSAYYWGSQLTSGVLIEGVSSYRPLGVPEALETIISEGDDKRFSVCRSFGNEKNLSMTWNSDPAGGKGNFACTGIVFVEADSAPTLLGFISY